MTIAPQSSMLRAFTQAGIISAAQYRRAVRHFRSSELARYADPAECLMWLVCREVMPEEQLRAACARATAANAGDGLADHRQALGNAVLKLDDFRQDFCLHWFDILVAEDLITPDERERALEDIRFQYALDSPGHALAWMAVHYDIDGSRVSLDAARAATGSARRIEILTDASARYARTRPRPDDVRKLALPRSTWLWIAAPVLFVAWMKYAQAGGRAFQSDAAMRATSLTLSFP